MVPKRNFYKNVKVNKGAIPAQKQRAKPCQVVRWFMDGGYKTLQTPMRQH